MATVKNTITLNDKMSPVLKTIIKSMQSTVTAMAGVDKVSNSAFKKMQKDVQAASLALDDMNSGLGQIPPVSNKVSDSFSKFRNPLVSAAAAIYTLKTGIQGLNAITDITDEFVLTGARLNLMNDGLLTQHELQNRILETARASRSEYNATAASVAKLGILAEDSFSSTEEIVQFAELMNKSFKVGGASIQEQTAGMYQLTQAMAAGKLQGDEFRSIMENAPLLAQAISEFTGVSKGELKEMSSDGTITADIIKAAMFSAADDINEKFKTIPMTFADWRLELKNFAAGKFMEEGGLSDKLTKMLNSEDFKITIEGMKGAIVSFLDLMEASLNTAIKISAFMSENWSYIAPVIWGVVGAMTAYKISMLWGAAATLMADGAAKAFFTTLLTNPFNWFLLLIGLVVAGIYMWIQSVGGLVNAWNLAKLMLAISFLAIRLVFMTAVDGILTDTERLKLGWNRGMVAIANYTDSMRVSVLTIIENMINSSIGLINKFIGMLNKLPGVSISAVEGVSFAATAKSWADISKKQRESNLSALESDIASKAAERESNISKVQKELMSTTQEFSKLYADSKAAAKATDSLSAISDRESAMSQAAIDAIKGSANPDGGKLDSVGKIKDDVTISDEDIKMLKDIAAVEFINKYTTLRPEMTVTFGDVRETADAKQLLTVIEDMIEEAWAASLVS